MVTVVFFARARDLAGVERMPIDITAATTVADLRRQLVEKLPALRQLLARCALAVNAEYADDADHVPAEAEVAVLPPVSGG